MWPAGEEAAGAVDPAVCAAGEALRGGAASGGERRRRGGGVRGRREGCGDAGENFGSLTVYLSHMPPGFGNFSKCWSIYSARICRGG